MYANLIHANLIHAFYMGGCGYPYCIYKLCELYLCDFSFTHYSHKYCARINNRLYGNMLRFVAKKAVCGFCVCSFSTKLMCV